MWNNPSKVVRYILFFLIAVLGISSQTNAQSKEFGGGLASFNYTGDLIRNYSIQNQTFGINLFYVKNYQYGWSGKLNFAAGRIKGSDENPIDPQAAIRSASFQDFITEISGQATYEFLDFRNDKALVKFTPYLTVGAGFFLINRAEKTTDYSDIQLMIPFGGGVKYSLGPLWTLNFEFSARKLFYDYLDNISQEIITDKRNSNFQFGDWNDNDWYYFTGFSISYTFWGVNCPVPLKK
ncbi:DUF6089 family protein [Marivirga sp.]|uniref:type IX secretion system protein PorG n=1 Tax=Marivirga sp. TaxID=2018662 RepID=UPI002D803B8F|nr:DUF6089 family protein [Marivirga sp.]HET8859919.1 DUF6089 family protein [Marivirga sp.]